MGAADAEWVFGAAVRCAMNRSMHSLTADRWQVRDASTRQAVGAPRKTILKAEPKRLAAFLEIDPGLGRLWRPEELAAIFKHQLAAPVQVDLAEGTSSPVPDLSSGFPEIRTFDELFHHSNPPIELLKSVKEFAKANRDHPASALPGEIATVLYYASVIVARWRCGEAITTLKDEELRTGIEWAIAEPWVDERTKSLLRKASTALDPARQGERQ